MTTAFPRGRAVLLSLYLANAVVGVLFLRSAIYAPFSHDEIEHAHASWRMLQGDLPYVAFRQNHAPTIWFLGAGLLRVLPHSAAGLLVLRWLCVGSFLIALTAGSRLLRRLSAGVDPTVYPLALLAALCLGFRFEWYRFRPDPFMSLLCTLALVVAAHGKVTHPRAAITGWLFGLAACFSPKMWPFLFLLPAYFGYEAWRARRARYGRPLRCLLSYALGGVAAGVPLVAWLISRDLWGPFVEEVIAFNLTHTKGFASSVRILSLAITFGIAAGACTLLWHAWIRRAAGRWPYVATAAGVALGVSINFFTPHGDVYNVQPATIPAAIAFAFAGAALLDGKRASTARLALLVLFLGFCLRQDVVGLARFRVSGWTITKPDLTALMDLVASRPGAGCVGFAPCHPVFCQSSVNVSMRWDANFLAHPNARFRARHERLWMSALEEIRQTRPRFVVGRCENWDPWTSAMATAPALVPAVQATLRELRAHYDPHVVGANLVWVARDDTGP